MGYILFQAKLPGGHTHVEAVDPTGKTDQVIYNALAIAAMVKWPGRAKAEAVNRLVTVEIEKVTAEKGQMTYQKVCDYDIHPSEVPSNLTDYEDQLDEVLESLPYEFKTAFRSYYERTAPKTPATLMRIAKVSSKLYWLLFDDIAGVAPPKRPRLPKRLWLEFVAWWKHIWRISDLPWSP